jgi:flagellar hook assembly protein FlgD
VTDEVTGNLPGKFEVYQNYPNPFNSSTLIRFKVPKTSFVRVGIFNTLGQEIRTIVEKELNPGDYRIGWNGRDRFGKKVSSGMYLYQVSAMGKVVTGRLLYIQ